MCVFRGIQTSFFGILMLLSAALAGQDHPSFTVRVGDEVTLPCGNLKKDQLSCDRTAWQISSYLNAGAVELVSDGKISKNEKAQAKSKRLRVTEDCSLVVTNISREDVGQYLCRQYRAEREHTDAYMYLSVFNTEEQDAVHFLCTLYTYDGSWHKVEWVYGGDVDDIEVSPGVFTAVVMLKTLHPDQKTLRDFRESMKCNVTDERSGRSLQMKVKPQSSAEDKDGSKLEEDATGGPAQDPSDWWRFAAAAAAIATLLIAVTMVMMYIRRKKSKGMETQRDEDTSQSLKPAESRCDAESRQEKEDPGDEVSYATISYTKKTSSKAQAADEDADGGGDAVTYSTVKVSSPADQASVDPSSLYATVHKAKRGEAPE